MIADRADGEAGAADAPFILTADLPPDLHSWATGLRTRFFPPERNYLEAHVTMFHALPAPYHAEIDGLLKRTARYDPDIPARITGISSLGRGTAIAIDSPMLMSVREGIVDSLHDVLTAQDRHKPRFHITVQNKVSSEEAKRVQAILRDQVEPRDFWFPSMTLHRYLGGPWERVKTYRFRG